METLKELGIKEEYEAECQRALKEIAKDDPEVAENIAISMSYVTDMYIQSRAHLAVTTNMPERFIMSAFSWADSEKGEQYWAEMTYKFCESHPMVSVEESPEEDEENSIKCNKCGSTNVSVSSFGDRTGVNCRDCGESRLLVD